MRLLHSPLQRSYLNSWLKKPFIGIMTISGSMHFLKSDNMLLFYVNTSNECMQVC